MDNKSNFRKSKYSGIVLLLTILIGFCILAIIEIVHGRAQTKSDRERLALQEKNYRAMEEVHIDENNTRSNSYVGAVPFDAADEEQDNSTESEALIENDKNYTMQIVVLGDNIMDQNREDNQDVPSLIGEACNAKVYNMSIRDTTAALLPGESADHAEWSSIGLLGVVNAILGNVEPDIFNGYEAGEILKECDFSDTDYFVIEYGLNDFSSRHIPQSRYLEGGEMLDIDEAHTYAGALDVGVRTLVQHFPNAKILLVSPHYCEFFEDGIYVGDAYNVNYGYGTLVDFHRITSYVAGEHRADNVLYFNAMDNSGIDAYTADRFLEDGVHLSNEGRRMYADKIAERINADFYRAE